MFEAKLREKLSAAAAQRLLRHSLAATRRILWLSKKTPWRMYLKAPFGGPEQVLRYLGRYTHRIAISNQRILGFAHGQVTFTYRDRKHDNVRKQMTLDANEFARRFLMHVLPRRFVRVRHYGILANSTKKRSVALSRELLGVPALAQPARPESWQEVIEGVTGVDPERCSRCGEGHYVYVQELPRDVLWLALHTRPPP